MCGLCRLLPSQVVALQLRTGWAEAAASLQPSLDPVVEELIGTPRLPAPSLGSNSLPPPLEQGRGRTKGKGRAKSMSMSKSKSKIAEFLVATPEELLLQLQGGRSNRASVEALEAQTVRRDPGFTQCPLPAHCLPCHASSGSSQAACTSS